MIIKRELYRYPLLIVDIIEIIFKSFFMGWKNFVFQGAKKRARIYYHSRINGIHTLKADSTGEITCDGCKVCEQQCPSQCITVEKQGNKLASFEIAMLKCTYCGICEEVCPIDAISLSNKEIKPGLAEQSWSFGKDILAYRKDINSEAQAE